MDDTDDDTDDDHDDTDDDTDRKNDSYTAAGAAPGASVPLQNIYSNMKRNNIIFSKDWSASWKLAL